MSIKGYERSVIKDFVLASASILAAGITGARIMPLFGDVNANSLIANAYLCSADSSRGNSTLISTAELVDEEFEGVDENGESTSLDY